MLMLFTACSLNSNKTFTGNDVLHHFYFFTVLLNNRRYGKNEEWIF
jgi:hypothetical protein